MTELSLKQCGRRRRDVTTMEGNDILFWLIIAVVALVVGWVSGKEATDDETVVETQRKAPLRRGLRRTPRADQGC
jgi:hypothetical protein